MGFFSATELAVLKPTVGRVAECGACGLYKTCKSPKMEPSGKYKKQIMILAEAPGKDEDDQGKQLVGNSGHELMRILYKHGIDMRRDCVLENSLRCRPPDNKIKNKKSIAYCRPNVINTIEEYNPVVIIVLGGVAVQSLLGWLWKEDIGGINRWAGFQIPNQRLNAWICPTFHPAYLLREKSPVLDKRFEEHLEAAVSHKHRPWEEKPDYEKKIQIVYNVSDVPRILERYKEGILSFDYETNMLKPDSQKARIVCCSFCWQGKETVAFPWHGEAIKATRKLLERRTIRLTAANLPFEDRWTRAKLGLEIGDRWLHDSVNGAHVIYNASKIRAVTSLKFQAFALLGIEPYDDHIKPFLKAKGGNGVNRIDQVDLKSLLLYNGLDSLFEFQVAKKQMKILKRGVL